MTGLSRALLLALALLAAPLAVVAQSLSGATDEARREAASLADALGTQRLMDQVVTGMREQMVRALAERSRLPVERVAPMVDDLLVPEFRARIPEAVAAVAEIWAAHFTVDEMRQVRAFYETPLGRKTLAVTPQIAQQSMAAGAEWGRRVGESAVAKHREALRARGLPL